MKWHRPMMALPLLSGLYWTSCRDERHAAGVRGLTELDIRFGVCAFCVSMALFCIFTAIRLYDEQR